MRTTALVGVAVAAVAVVGYLVLRPDPEVAGVTKPPNAGGGHVAAATYPSATPTSGPHDAAAPACGVTGDPLAPELAVHALEHGAVVVWYRPDLDESVRADATELLDEWDSHWVLSPNPGIEEAFVATAWNRLKAFEAPDASLREFVDTYRGRGPEDIDCPA